ncbi:MAG: type II secretion system F family protein [Bauldia sp.]|nr:type II secretion system F family protein [Bauldia sp.]
MTEFLTPQMTVIALAVLAMLAVGGLTVALFYGRIRGVSQAEKRQAAIADRSAAVVNRAKGVDQAARRRKAVQDSLRDLEAREKARALRHSSPPLELRLEQAGLDWSRQTFFLVGAMVGLVVAIVGYLILGLPIYAIAAFGVAGALGFPFWLVNWLRKRRMKLFLNEFPAAVDIIVRGVKAGLPLNDCLRIIANEAKEPVRTEFRLIHERQTLGQSVTDAVTKLPERVPVPEANFFAIVVAIQQKAGGNLSEVLGNLSKVLRERAKMRGKIRAMSMEAKASAWIIGSLPIVVMVLVYLTSPEYIMRLFTEPVGHIILGASAIWMGIGVYVMRRMINFDF